jgi:hypothetical protein
MISFGTARLGKIMFTGKVKTRKLSRELIDSSEILWLLRLRELVSPSLSKKICLATGREELMKLIDWSIELEKTISKLFLVDITIRKRSRLCIVGDAKLVL